MYECGSLQTKITQCFPKSDKYFMSTAFTHGDPVRLLTPTDSTGLRCGLDAKVKNKPYLFFFDLSKCASQTAIMNGCPTPQV